MMVWGCSALMVRRMSSSDQPIHPDRIIAEAVQRDHRLELHYMSNSGEVMVGHTRMVGCDGQTITVAAPQGVGKAVHFHTDKACDAYLFLEQQMYRFKTTVVSSACRVRLNERMMISGMLIARPNEVIEGQRRANYRSTLLHDEPLAVVLHETDGEAEGPNFCPLEGVTIHGRLVDISEGGLGVRVETGLYSRFKIGMLFFAETRLNDVNADLYALVELRQARPILEGTATKLGFMFRAWPDVRTFRRNLDPIRRLVVQLERTKAANKRVKAA